MIVQCLIEYVVIQPKLVIEAQFLLVYTYPEIFSTLLEGSIGQTLKILYEPVLRVTFSMFTVDVFGGITKRFVKEILKQLRF